MFDLSFWPLFIFNIDKIKVSEINVIFRQVMVRSVILVVSSFLEIWLGMLWYLWEKEISEFYFRVFLILTIRFFGRG